MSSIKQLQVAYEAHQDRALVRFSTETGHEFRLWLTRRAVRLMWPRLRELLSQTAGPESIATPAVREAVLSFKHEQAMSKASRAERFETPPETQLPLGETPMLVGRMTINQAPDGGLKLGFHPAEGQGIDVAFGETLAHGFCDLLSGVADKADWNLDLNLGQASTAPADNAVRH